MIKELPWSLSGLWKRPSVTYYAFWSNGVDKISTKFPLQKIRWNYGIKRSDFNIEGSDKLIVINPQSDIVY